MENINIPYEMLKHSSRASTDIIECKKIIFLFGNFIIKNNDIFSLRVYPFY